MNRQEGDHGWAGTLHPTAEHKHIVEQGREHWPPRQSRPKSGPRQALRRSRRHSPSLPVSFVSAQQLFPPSHVDFSKALSYSEITPRSLCQKKKRAKPRFLVPGSWLQDCLTCSNSRVDLAAARRHESSAPFNSRALPHVRVVVQLLLRLQPHSQPRSSRASKRGEENKKKQRRIPCGISDSEPARLPGCQDTRSPYPPMWKGPVLSPPVCRGLTPPRIPDCCAAGFDWSGPSTSSFASRRWSEWKERASTQ